MKIIRGKISNTFFIVENGILLTSTCGRDEFSTLHELVDCYCSDQHKFVSKFSCYGYKHYPHLFEVIVDLDNILELSKLKMDYPELFI